MPAPIKFILIYGLFFSLLLLAHEHFKDYCFEQHRELTDKEYLTIAFNYFRENESKHIPMKLHDWDNTIDTYLLHHPGCCWISKEYDLGPWSTEITARITYELADETKTTIGAGKYTHYDGLVNISVCGKPYAPTGEPISAPASDFNQLTID